MCGDEFFDLIYEYFVEFDLEEKTPRDEKLTKESVLEAVLNDPIFSKLKGNPKYESIIYQIKNSVEGMRVDILKEYWPFLIPLVIINLILALTALIHVIKHPHYRFGNKVIWILIVLFVQLIGPVMYFTFGRGEE